MTLVIVPMYDKHASTFTLDYALTATTTQTYIPSNTTRMRHHQVKLSS